MPDPMPETGIYPQGTVPLPSNLVQALLQLKQVAESIPAIDPNQVPATPRQGLHLDRTIIIRSVNLIRREFGDHVRSPNFFAGTGNMSKILEEFTSATDILVSKGHVPRNYLSNVFPHAEQMSTLQSVDEQNEPHSPQA